MPSCNIFAANAPELSAYHSSATSSLVIVAKSIWDSIDSFNIFTSSVSFAVNIFASIFLISNFLVLGLKTFVVVTASSTDALNQ